MADSSEPVDFWRPVPGFEQSYRVSRDGTIERTRRGGRSEAGRTLRGRTDKGIRRVQLCEHGHRVRRSVFQIVCEAFIGPRPSPLHHAARVAGVIRWALPIEIMAHAKVARGEQCHDARLTEAQVKEIRARWKTENPTQVGLGREYGVSNVAIRKIITRQSWRHLP